jgi:hypothetical protein
MNLNVLEQKGTGTGNIINSSANTERLEAKRLKRKQKKKNNSQNQINNDIIHNEFVNDNVNNSAGVEHENDKPQSRRIDPQSHQRNQSSRLDFSRPDPYIYNFALNPEQYQPSGSVNFSRIGTSGVPIGRPSYNMDEPFANTTPLWIFAQNYNLMRVMNGMGSIAYS